jgi:hypothetical protein
MPSTISDSEVTNISSSGFWLLVEDREYFIPFVDYPDFRDATVAQIFEFQQPGPSQFYWPGLDIDIELDALKNPERFPLSYQP